MNKTIQRHLAGRRIEELPSDDDELVGFWTKVLLAYRDTGSADSSPANRLLRAYDSGRLVALTMMREAGYRIKGAEGQHFTTFDIARSLATTADLRQVLDDVNDLRLLRHQVEYEYHDDADEAAAAKAIALARRAIELGAAYLREVRPSLAARIPRTKPRGS